MRMLWEDLRPYVPSKPIPWMAISGFNVILSSNNKSGGKSCRKMCPSFGKFVESNELQWSFITWQKGRTFERLDQAAIYGHIGTRRKKLVNTLTDLQKEMERATSVHLAQREEKVREELESVLYHEELLWKKKS
ncbi:hypothetical protein J1N35_034738 [Gossypium stocksii]|uniref:Uncharacterized protein n=1 Tax=Gossypium stocksii TaxID=47602 RepID=A0A9D3USK6_9ROSI|nr:hypothetical protein J1N35_034738 [Gossypium stocksii]